MLLKQRPIETFVFAKTEILIILTFTMISRHWLLLDKLVSLNMTFLNIYSNYWVTCSHYILWLIVVFELSTAVQCYCYPSHHSKSNKSIQSSFIWIKVLCHVTVGYANIMYANIHDECQQRNKAWKKKKRGCNWIRGKTWRCQWQWRDKELEEQYLDQW